MCRHVLVPGEKVGAELDFEGPVLPLTTSPAGRPGHISSTPSPAVLKDQDSHSVLGPPGNIPGRSEKSRGSHRVIVAIGQR